MNNNHMIEPESKRLKSEKRYDKRVILINKLMVSLGQGIHNENHMLSVIIQVGKMKSAMMSDLDNYSDNVVEALVECGTDLAWKGSVYALLLAILPTDVQENVVSELFSKLYRVLEHDLSSPSVSKQVSMILRFFCELTNVNIFHEGEIAAFFSKLAETNPSLAACSLQWLKSVDIESINQKIFSKSDIEWIRLVADSKNKANSPPYLLPQIYSGQESTYTRRAGDYVAFNFPVDLLEKLQSVPYAPPTSSKINIFSRAWKLVEAVNAANAQVDGLSQSNPTAGLQTAAESVASITDYERWLLAEYVNDILIGYFPSPEEATASIRAFDARYHYELFSLLIEKLCNTIQKPMAMFIMRILADLQNGSTVDEFKSIAEDARDAIVILVPSLNPLQHRALVKYFGFTLFLVNMESEWSKWAVILSEMKDSPRYQFLIGVLYELSELSSTDDVESMLPENMKASFSSLKPEMPAESLSAKLTGIMITNPNPDQEAIVDLFESHMGTGTLDEKFTFFFEGIYSSDSYMLRKNFEYFIGLLRHLIDDNGKASQSVLDACIAVFTPAPRLIPFVLLLLFEYAIVSMKHIVETLSQESMTSKPWVLDTLTDLYNVEKKQFLTCVKSVMQTNPSNIEVWQLLSTE